MEQMRWYIVQVYTGYENIVREDLLQRIKEEQLEEYFGEIIVPVCNNSEQASLPNYQREKIYPGYMFVQMIMTGDTFRLVQSTSRVTHFLGNTKYRPSASDDPTHIQPMTDKEVEHVFAQMSSEKLELPSEKVVYVPGSSVHIADGPFSGVTAIVDSVNVQQERLTVMVSIFGRLTPVELRFDQVKQ